MTNSIESIDLQIKELQEKKSRLLEEQRAEEAKKKSSTFEKLSRKQMNVCIKS